MPDLPTPRTATDTYLAAIHDRLGELLDRLPDRTAGAWPDGSVELREPAAPAPVGGGEAPPSETDVGGDSGPGAKRRPGRTSTTTKTARKRTISKPKES